MAAVVAVYVERRDQGAKKKKNNKLNELRNKDFVDFSSSGKVFWGSILGQTEIVESLL